MAGGVEEDAREIGRASRRLTHSNAPFVAEVQSKYELPINAANLTSTR
jgi:hypothetical protein